MSTKKLQSKKDHRVSKSLVALSSTAVLAVYATGYVRTQPAAERFAAEEAARKPGLPKAPDVVATPVETAVTATSNEVLTVALLPSPQSVQPPSSEPSTPAVVPIPPANETASMASTPPAVVRATSIIPPSPVIPAATTSTAALPVALVPPTTVTVPATTPVAALVGKYKDGTYIGWGTCRHGDIQVGVVIKEGRIFSVLITQCLTRYDCDIIAKLPKQAVARQSADVDYVSGATQSTNAFYYAVVEALSKAK